MEIYKSPESNVVDEGHIIARHGFWRSFFWINAILLLMISLMLVFIDNLSVFDYVDILVFVLGVVSLYGYVFLKRLGGFRLWRVFGVIYPLWAIFYGVVVGFVLDIPQYGEPAVLDVWLILDPLFIIPTCVAIYLYGYKSNQIWQS